MTFHRHLPSLAIFLVLISGGLASAENLIFNSGFELGEAGYSIVKYLREAGNPALQFEGLAADTEDLVSGKSSIRIPNRFGESVEFYSTEFELQGDSLYTLSVSMKSTVKACPVRLQVYSVNFETKKREWVVHCKDVSVGTAWKRFVYAFKTGTGRGGYYKLKLRTCWRAGDPAADLWLDNLALNPGKAETYRPAATIEAAVMAEEPVYTGPQSVTTQCRLANHSDREQRVDLRLRAVEDYWGNEVLSGDRQVTLKPHERRDIDIDLPLARYGSYHIEPVLKTDAKTKTLGTYVSLAGKVRRQPLSPRQQFSVGFNGGIYYQTEQHNRNQAGYKVYNAPLDAAFKILATNGIRMIRDWDSGCKPFAWSTIEAREGIFDFTLTDRLVNLAGRHGMHVLPVLGGMEFIDRRGQCLPEWVLRKSQKKADFPLKRKYTQGALYLPPINLWKRYIHEIAARYRGKITHYEIMNEPNLIFNQATDYLVYLKAAYEEIKKTDPAAQVVGLCCTGDLGGNVQGFMAACLENGAATYCDAISFHPYDAPNLAAVHPADVQIENLKSLIGRHHSQPVPLWNTELYYLTGKGLNNTQLGNYQAHDLLQRLLTDLGEGVGQSICVPQNSLWKFASSPHLEWDLSEYVPTASLVAVNAFVRLLDGAKPVTKIRWRNDAVCYVYQRKGAYLAAFWNYGALKGLKVRIPGVESNMKIYDLFGNPVAAKAHSLPLTAAPTFVKWLPNTRDAFVKTLKHAVIEAENPVIPAKLVRLFPQNGTCPAAIGLKNLTGKTVRGRLGIRGEAAVAPNSVGFELPANAQRTIMVPVNVKRTEGGKAEIKIYVAGNLRGFPVDVLPASKVYAAPGPAEPILNNVRNVKPAHQASFQIAREANRMLLTIEVKDKTPSGEPRGRHPWQQDCVELFVDAAPGHLPYNHPTTHHGKVGRFFIMPYASPDKRLLIWPKALKKLTPDRVRLQTELTPNGYLLKLSLPFEALELSPSGAGAVLGFDIAVDDANGPAKARSVLTWNSPGKAHADRCSFGFVEFK
jgi:hypothetical protein